MFGGFTARPNFGNQLYPTRTLGQFGNQATQIAANFLNATQISDPTIVSAINQLVSDLFFYGLIPKMKAIYPFVGGTAALHKFNLLDPRDLDIAFRLTFTGGWVHSQNGALPNGTNSYANTFLSPSATLTSFNSSLSFYSRTNATAQDRASMGSVNDPLFTIGHQLILKWSDGNFYGILDNNGFSASSANTNSTGFYIASRTANNSLKTYKNNSLAATNNTITIALSNTIQMFIGARNIGSGVAQLFDNKQCAFASIGDGLTDTEAANFYTAVQNFNTTLGRQV